MAWPMIAKIAMMAMSQSGKGGGGPTRKEKAHSRVAETEAKLKESRAADPMASALPGAQDITSAPPITEQFASGDLRQGAAQRALKAHQPIEAPPMETTDDLKAGTKDLMDEPIANKAEEPAANKLPAKNKADTLVY
tara:strand:+ start:117 stop:527 length:411 start_codon:yes stop_codon:yes gene_type:complete